MNQILNQFLNQHLKQILSQHLNLSQILNQFLNQLLKQIHYQILFQILNLIMKPFQKKIQQMEHQNQMIQIFKLKTTQKARNRQTMIQRFVTFAKLTMPHGQIFHQINFSTTLSFLTWTQVTMCSTIIMISKGTKKKSLRKIKLNCPNKIYLQMEESKLK